MVKAGSDVSSVMFTVAITGFKITVICEQQMSKKFDDRETLIENKNNIYETIIS